MPLHITNLPSLVIRDILSLLPATDQVKVLMVWPEWCPLATRRQLSISPAAVGCDSVDETFASTHNVLQLFPYLTHLDLSGMTVAKASIISQVGSCGATLKVLKLGLCCSAEERLCDMVRNLGELEEFHARFRQPPIWSVTSVLQALLSTATGLHTLDLSGSWNVTAAAFQGLRQRLQVLNLSQVTSMSPTILHSVLAPSKESLQVLNMTFCLPMLHGSVAEALCAFRHLTHLYLPPPLRLTTCEHPSAEATHLAKLARLHHLQHLHIPDDYCVHEADVLAIHNGCPRIITFRRPPCYDH